MTITLIAALGLILGALNPSFAAEKDAESDSEAKKGFLEDKGPDTIDVSSYTAEQQENYKAFARKCSRCHTLARPINSQYLELSQEEQGKARIEDPELFKDEEIVSVGQDVWKRYVKRMMNKPGCPVRGKDGKKMWEFLVYDSKVRKMGPNAAAWRAHRKKLVEDFKKQHPD